MIDTKCLHCGKPHRFDGDSGFVRCECGWRLQIGNPAGVMAARNANRVTVQTILTPKQKAALDKSRLLWDVLHRSVRDRKSYNTWLAQVPKFGCSCQDHWNSLVGTPSDDQLADPWWGFDRHNDVNSRLRKPVFTEQEAMEMYQWGERASGPSGPG